MSCDCSISPNSSICISISSVSCIKQGENAHIVCEISIWYKTFQEKAAYPICKSLGCQGWNSSDGNSERQSQDAYTISSICREGQVLKSYWNYKYLDKLRWHCITIKVWEKKILCWRCITFQLWVTSTQKYSKQKTQAALHSSGQRIQ